MIKIATALVATLALGLTLSACNPAGKRVPRKAETVKEQPHTHTEKKKENREWKRPGCVGPMCHRKNWKRDMRGW